MTKDKCREEFEVYLRKVWFYKTTPFLRQCNDPESDRYYQDYDTDFAWTVWQKAYRTQPDHIADAGKMVEHSGDVVERVAKSIQRTFPVVNTGVDEKGNWGARPLKIELFEKIVQEVISALPSENGDGWLPISEAPKDGTNYLATNSAGIYAVCHWNKMDWANSEPCVFPMSDATHFMPLPKPSTENNK
jgi:hypothetical protein